MMKRKLMTSDRMIEAGWRQCFAGGARGFDGGTTTLTSRILNASDFGRGIADCCRHSNNLGGAPNANSMPISIPAKAA